MDTSTRKNMWLDKNLAKKQAANLRHKVINNLDKYLIEFEKNSFNNQAKVVWAPAIRDAQKEITQIIRKSKMLHVAMTGGKLIEELELNDLLTKKRQAGEGNELPGIVITEALFLTAESGTAVCLPQNGSEKLMISAARILIIVAGIESLISMPEDIELFYILYRENAVSFPQREQDLLLLSGPKTAQDPDGPEEVYIILTDNKRTEVLRFREQRKILFCIRCDACTRVCPISELRENPWNEAFYKGPAGSVMAPFYLGFRDNHYLSFASTLCGKCTEVCPMHIPLHDLLMENRHEALLKNVIPARWKRGIRFYTYLMTRRWLLDKTGHRIKTRLMIHYVRKSWTSGRKLPTLPRKTFKEIYKETYPER